jgi:hypothetical protein
VRVQHDGAVLDIAVLLEKTRDVGLSQTRVDTSDEQVGAGVLSALLLFFLDEVGLAQGARAAEDKNLAKSRKR